MRRRQKRIFDAVRKVVDQSGVLSGRVRLGCWTSSVLDDAVVTQDTVTMITRPDSSVSPSDLPSAWGGVVP